LWGPDEAGETLEGVVTSVNPVGKYGLQVKVMDDTGTIWTLPAHKWLQGLLESVPGLRPTATVLKVTYIGNTKSKNWPTPTEKYDVDYRAREPGEFGLD
jgi:hypothetical protein